MYCISISHKKTPLEIRKKYAFTDTEKEEFEENLMKFKGIHSVVLLSTCNRTEIYFNSSKKEVSLVIEYLSIYKNMDIEDGKKYINTYSYEEAVKHLFRVCAGLDSMLLGEDDILRQVKKSYLKSFSNGNTHNILNIAFQGALNFSKISKTKTNISKIPLSISTLTVYKTLSFLEENKGKNILITGITGDMGKKIAKSLMNKSGYIIYASLRDDLRKKENLENIIYVDYNNRYNYIDRADVIISATKSPHYIYSFEEVKKSIIAEKERLFIDLSLPSDIDLRISHLDKTGFLDMDSFSEVSKDMNLLKIKEAKRSEVLLSVCLEEIMKKIYFNKFRREFFPGKKSEDEKLYKNLFYKAKKTLDSEEFKGFLNSFIKIDMHREY
jgi:glutamyl-tRNA reductase